MTWVAVRSTAYRTFIGAAVKEYLRIPRPLALATSEGALRIDACRSRS
jgi:hypothetical protein